MKFLHLHIIFLLLKVVGYGQNLVPNGGFEQYNQCPTADGQIQFANGWDNFLLTPDYFNACASNSDFSVPYNFYGSYQPVSSGQAYAGVFTYYSAWPWSYNNRENIAYQLTSTLVPGTKYYVSFKASLAFNNFSAYCATNNLGAKFTTQSYSVYATDSVTSPLIDNSAQVYYQSIITDSVNWVTVKGSFVADSAFKYVVIGNFFDDAHTDSLVFVAANTCQAYYYIDEVCVSTDSVTCDFVANISTNDRLPNITIYPNPCTDYFEVTIPEGSTFCNKESTIRLLNMFGKQILSEAISNNSKTSIYTDGISKGTYLVQFVSEQQPILSKIITIN